MKQTKYYRAIYMTSIGEQQEEVFISEDLDSAREYATGMNARGRQLKQIEEFTNLIDSLL